MPDDKVYKTTLRHKGVFSLKEFYDLFFSLITGYDYTVMEDTHSQKSADTGDEIEVTWDFSKDVDDYTRFKIKVYFLIEDLKSVIIKKVDKEIKTNEGKVKVIIEGIITTDWQGNFDKTPFLQKLRSFYEDYLFRKTLDKYEGEVYTHVNTIIGELKAFLELPHFM